MTIGVFDSGLGGLTVVASVLKHLHGADIHYVADTAHAPYGEKTFDDIRRYAFDITRTLRKRFDIDALVIACNTATAAAVADLRRHFPDLLIIGTEPGIKPAALATRSGTVGVLATPATIAGDKYKTLAHTLQNDFTFTLIEQPCPGLADRIEAGKAEDEETEKMLRRWLEPMRDKGVDTIVLGCTHYPLVAPVIRRIMGDRVTLIDTGDAVARHLADRLRDRITKDNTRPSRLFVYATGDINTDAVARIVGFYPPVAAW